MYIRILIAFLLSSSLATNSSRAATVVADTGRGGTHVSAFRGIVIWSSYRQSSRRWYLVARNGGTTSRVGVPGRSLPFDVDLGPGPRGGVSAVYSRCTSAGPNPYQSGGCNIFRYDFATRREVRLSALYKRGFSATNPAVWKDNIAYVRSADRPRSADEALPVVMLKRGSHAPVGLHGGSPGTPELVEGSEYQNVPSVLGIDLRGDRVLYAWDLVPEPGTCVDTNDAETSDLPDEQQELWTEKTGGWRLLGRGCAKDELSGYGNPQFVASGVVGFSYQLREDLPHGVRYRRERLDDKTVLEDALISQAGSAPVAFDGSALYRVEGRTILRSRL